MRFYFSSDLNFLAQYLPRFLAIVGQDALFKRLNEFDAQQKSSPFLWKIISDYHWLEMAIGFQAEVLEKNGRLLPDLVDPLIMAALSFAGAVVEIHERLSEPARRRIEGRLRDGLKAETGFAPLFLEVDLALRILVDGYDVQFPDLEGTEQFDIKFSRAKFVGEIECKSLSVDAGRQIHRKDFYRFIVTLAPALEAHAGSDSQEILLITLKDRLSPNTANQKELKQAAVEMLRSTATATWDGTHFRMVRKPYRECLGDIGPQDERQLYTACTKAFGQNTHVAGGLSETGGCLVVMRSEREDDTSKPLLEAMRKAASQFSRKHPAFIAVQFQDISAPDLMSTHLRRRAGIISYALYGHYGADHVNATYMCGFASAVYRDGQLGSPAFAIPNPRPRYAVEPQDASPFLVTLTDAEYADAIGAPLPHSNISHILL